MNRLSIIRYLRHLVYAFGGLAVFYFVAPLSLTLGLAGFATVHFLCEIRREPRDRSTVVKDRFYESLKVARGVMDR